MTRAFLALSLLALALPLHAQEVSPQRLKADVETLVGFGTRHTMSSPTDPKRGIGARAPGPRRSSRRAAPPVASA
jgi:hypothetical protein